MGPMGATNWQCFGTPEPAYHPTSPYIGNPAPAQDGGLAIASRPPLMSPRSIDIGRTPLDPVGRRSASHVEVNIGPTERISVTTVHATH